MENTEKPKAKRAKKKEAQRWPYIKRRPYPSGLVSWIVDARTKSGGERKTFVTLAEAETYADGCRIRRSNEGLGAFGNVELARFGKTVQEAINFYLEHLRQQERSVPVKDAIIELVAVRRSSGQSELYCCGLKTRLERFQVESGDHAVAAIESKQLDAWLSGLKVGPATRNTYRRDLRTLFSFCVKRGYMLKNPATATERAKQHEKPPGILTPQEATNLLNACDKDILPYFAIGMFAGLRRSELEKLDWQEINMESNFIEIKASKAKTAQRRLVKIEPILKLWLKPVAKNASPVVLSGYLDRRLETMRKAGFGRPGTETEEEKKSKITLKPWPLNALRHSFGSYWLAKFKDTAALALQMGNSPQIIFAHYRELVRPDDAKQFWNIKPDLSFDAE